MVSQEIANLSYINYVVQVRFLLLPPFKWKDGRVWFKALVLKTSIEKSILGPNPNLSATYPHSSTE